MDEAEAMRAQLETLFRAGLDRVDPYRMLVDRVRLEGNTLKIRLDDRESRVDLGSFRRIFVVGAGKATASMAAAVERILGDRIDRGVVAVKYGHTAPLSRIRILEAGHPVPDAQGVAAAREVARMVDEADASTLVIGLMSGGGSAILPSPLEYGTGQGAEGLSLEDKQAATRTLLACGADIREINCIRKHLSGLKGGRLLQRIAPARSLNFILSDVVGDDLSSIASGMTVSDPSTFGDALEIVDRYGIRDRMPPDVLRILERGSAGEIEETLKEEAFAGMGVSNFLIGTNRSALAAAARQAERMGYRVRALTSRIGGEAREVARLLAGIALDVKNEGLLVERPACVIAGGEPVVTLRGKGKGGRNQEMALAFLSEMEGDPDAWRGVFFLAASTDGNDGPTDAAGAFADVDLLLEARRMGIDLRGHLADNDAYRFFDRIGGLLRTGPTNTNVCDLQVLLVP